MLLFTKQERHLNNFVTIAVFNAGGSHIILKAMKKHPYDVMLEQVVINGTKYDIHRSNAEAQEG